MCYLLIKHFNVCIGQNCTHYVKKNIYLFIYMKRSYRKWREYLFIYQIKNIILYKFWMKFFNLVKFTIIAVEWYAITPHYNLNPYWRLVKYWSLVRKLQLKTFKFTNKEFPAKNTVIGWVLCTKPRWFIK